MTLSNVTVTSISLARISFTWLFNVDEEGVEKSLRSNFEPWGGYPNIDLLVKVVSPLAIV